MSARVPEYERLVLECGATLILMPQRDVPLVTFNALLRGGALADPPGRSGVASLLAGLLEKGAGERDARAFADAVEGVGGRFGAGAAPEAIDVRGQFLARDQQLMLELGSEALLRPRLAASELASLRARRIELIKATKDTDPAELIGRYGRALLFGAHPYGRPVCGSEASLAAICDAHVLGYHREQFGAERLVLVLAGDIDAGSLARAAERRLAAWPRAPVPAASPPQPARRTSRRVLLIDFPGSAQSYFWIGSVGVAKGFPRRAALDLANTLFGGRFTSMLNTELRINSGLSYGARSGFARGSVPGEFSIRSFAQTADTGRALELTLRTLERFRNQPVTQEALDSARAYVLGQYPLGLETAADWAAAVAELELYRLGNGYIENYPEELLAVTLADVRGVIEEAFPPADAVAIVVIGDAWAIAERLRPYGRVTQMSLTDPDFTPAAGSSSGS